MAEPKIRQRMRATMLTLGVAVLSFAVSTAPNSVRASAPVRSRTADKSLPVPGAFRLQASNGYSLVVLGLPAHDGRAAAVGLFVSRKHQGVLYSAPAKVTETSIQANLGELGEISVTFHPSGQAATASPRCKGGRAVSYDSGYYEGSIDFHGEEGYTEVDATSAPGNIDFWLSVLCTGVGGGGGSFLPGAELQVRNPQLGPKFSVVKNRPDARARIEVDVSEYRSGISIDRFTTLLMPASTFRFDPRLQTATLHPPAPFSGTGLFDRSKKGGKRWSGDLTIDMPGRENVALTGSALRATLVHAEWGNGGE